MKTTVILSVLCVLVVTGCLDDKKEANETNFRAAIEKTYDPNSRECFDLFRTVSMFGDRKWPIEWDSEARNNDVLLALTAAGLLSKTTGESRTQTVWSQAKKEPVPKQVKLYSLTDAGKKLVEEKEVDTDGEKVKVTKLCWGHTSLDKIVKWTPPTTVGPYTVSEVTFTYKVSNVAEWAKRSDVQKAIADVRGIIRAAGKEHRAMLRLTNEGWEAERRGETYE